MNQVFIIFEFNPHDGITVRGVCDSEEMAKKIVEQKEEESWFSKFYYEPWKINVIY